jgi:hypothetical protein
MGEIEKNESEASSEKSKALSSLDDNYADDKHDVLLILKRMMMIFLKKMLLKMKNILDYLILLVYKHILKYLYIFIFIKL